MEKNRAEVQNLLAFPYKEEYIWLSLFPAVSSCHQTKQEMMRKWSLLLGGQPKEYIEIIEKHFEGDAGAGW